MTDANTICHDLDLLGDWLDAKGYTEEAGLCLRVLGLIHEQAEEIEKTKRFYIEAGFELRQLRGDNERLRTENEKLRAVLKPFADKEYAYEGWADTARDAVWFNISDLRAAAAALKETGDE